MRSVPEPHAHPDLSALALTFAYVVFGVFCCWTSYVTAGLSHAHSPFTFLPCFGCNGIGLATHLGNWADTGGGCFSHTLCCTHGTRRASVHIAATCPPWLLLAIACAYWGWLHGLCWGRAVACTNNAGLRLVFSQALWLAPSLARDLGWCCPSFHAGAPGAM